MSHSSLPRLSCNAFGLVARDQFYNQLQAPCLVSRTQEEVINIINNGGDTSLRLINDIDTTVPVAGDIITTGTGGNRTVGDNSNNFSVQHLRSLSQFVVGDAIDTSEYQDLQTALNATSPTPIGTFNVVYLQPGIQYAGNVTIPSGTILRGQEGAAIVGNVTIPAAATVFLIDAVVFGTVTSSGQTLTTINSILVANPGTNAVNIVSGGFNAVNTSISSSGLGVGSASLLIDGAGTIDVNGGVIQNTNPAGSGVFMQNTYVGPAYFRGARFPGGDQRFVNSSFVEGNNFDGNSTNAVFLELQTAANGTILNFTNNLVNGVVSIVKNASPSDSSINFQGNTVKGATVAVAITSNLAPGVGFLPHAQLRDNIVPSGSVSTSFTANAAFGIVLMANNYIGGSGGVTHTLISGPIQQVTMIGNQVSQGSVTYNEVLAYLQHNLIENPVGVPFNLAYSQGPGANNHYLINNWLSTTGAAFDVISASLSGGAHTLQLMQNNLLTGTAPQTLFAVALAGGSTFLSDGLSDNINASAVGTAPGAIPLV